MEEAALLLRLNPFALSHHSDSLSASPVQAARIPAEPDRHDFKIEVAKYYGLVVKGHPELLRNMLNETVPFAEATIAFIWPAEPGPACQWHWHFGSPRLSYCGCLLERKKKVRTPWRHPFIIEAARRLKVSLLNTYNTRWLCRLLAPPASTLLCIWPLSGACSAARQSCTTSCGRI